MYGMPALGIGLPNLEALAIEVEPLADGAPVRDASSPLVDLVDAGNALAEHIRATYPRDQTACGLILAWEYCLNVVMTDLEG
jgi:hypothetical protein